MIRVFTTRPDTIFGVTFLVLAPEHPLVKLLVNSDTKEKVEQYCRDALKKSEIERQENKEKTGIFTGSYAINPATGEKIPIWVADYVLMGYGTGAIMAVPAHDERDFEFAEKFDLPVKEVIEKPENSDDSGRCYHGEGELVNSAQFNGARSEDAREQVVAWLEGQGLGHQKVTYRMRDWLISRQRYWGCPIPIAYDKDGEAHPIPEDQLPVMHPEVKDYQPDDSGRSPLAKAEDWLKVTLKDENGNDIECIRETDTLDGYACSSWYLWRYVSPHDKEAAWDPQAVQYWAPTDIYCGGDHAVAHLLYVRFWCKFFADQGYLPFREPVKKLLYNGYINAPDGKKMSKSKGNVIDPLEVIESGYGADTLRTYEMFIGAFELSAGWSEDGVKGCRRFLERVWKLQDILTDDMAYSEDLETKMHQTIKKVSNDFESLKYNTAIAAMMALINDLYKKNSVTKGEFKTLITLLNPVAPHITEELWQRVGFEGRVYQTAWPEFDEAKTVESTVEIAVQINGKTRATLAIGKDDPKDEVIAKAKEVIAEKLTGTIVKEIYVPGRIVNIVQK